MNIDSGFVANFKGVKEFMKRIRWVSLLLCAFLVLAAVGCGSGQEGQDQQGNHQDAFSAGMVTDTGGSTMNPSTNGLGRDGESKERSWMPKSKYLGIKRDEDYLPNLTRFAREKQDIIWGIGFKFENVIPQVANQFQIKIRHRRHNLGGEIPDNVVAVTFKEHEGSFLMGVIAGSMTKTDKVGFIGGI